MAAQPTQRSGGSDLDTLVAELRRWADATGKDQPAGFNYRNGRGDWYCGECGKNASDGHAEKCFKRTLWAAAEAIVRLDMELSAAKTIRLMEQAIDRTHTNEAGQRYLYDNPRVRDESTFP